MSFRDHRLVYLLILCLFPLIYVQVFFSGYAYLDEVHQLWHNNDNSNFVMFHTQGRWLSGLIFQFFYSSISKIEQLKLIRIFSLVGWVVTSCTWAYFFRKWARLLNLTNELWWLSIIYVVCSIPVCIYIGWASCFEIFIAVIFGLLSAHILFTSLMAQQKSIQLPGKIIAGTLISAIISLFIYQPSFGIFIVPFLLRYITQKKVRPEREVVIGIVFYLAIYVVYYMLFKYSLRAYHLEASNRTELHFNFLKKLSFFFSGPFPQGFSLNLLFSASSIFSQIFYPIVFIVWLVLSWKRNKERQVSGHVAFVVIVLFLLALIYLPSMIAPENFPSYRSLFPFNLAVFLLVIETLTHYLKKVSSSRVFAACGTAWLLATAVYAFNFQFIIPLKKEYVQLRLFFQKNYTSSHTRIYFIRADKYLFSRAYHTRVYRDEFGAPSTYRDWVPEPIVKQIILELTGNRQLAEKTVVIQFENGALFTKEDREKAASDSRSLVIDMNAVFGDRQQTN